jgi:hypothetical protein
LYSLVAHFGRPIRGAANRQRLIRALAHFRKTKVVETRIAALIQEDIVRLDIPMQDRMAVEVLHGKSRPVKHNPLL